MGLVALLAIGYADGNAIASTLAAAFTAAAHFVDGLAGLVGLHPCVGNCHRLGALFTALFRLF